MNTTIKQYIRKINTYRYYILATSIFLGISLLAVSSSDNCPHFNWEKIDTSKIYFPKNFLWGIALCEYQNSGATCCKKSNWSDWETRSISPIKNGQMSAGACDHWNNYKQDIELMKQLGVNSVRFSVEWSKIEPQEGIFDPEALEHYIDLCNELEKAHIKPLITLHHFTHPTWFEQKGGFEKEENIELFVRFCTKIFETLSDKVQLWCTINEPTIYMFQGYIRGVFPPGKTNIALALKVLKNLLNAHTQVYTKLKSMTYGDKAQIGFVHQYLLFEPYSNYNIIERAPSAFLNYILNTTVLQFCATGEYSVTIPGLISLSYKAQANTKILDFIGLNYYSRALLKSQISLSEPIVATCRPGEIMTDMPYAIYAQGLYKAIDTLARIGVPIYITENGIADAQDNRRELFLKQYLYALSKALEAGYDVRGYYYWTLMDNFEWDEGFNMKFGLYQTNFQTHERTLRNGALYYKKVISQFK